MKLKKKLIEVALPLEAINKASAREKSIRHGHPSTLHLWWARRPLAAARAVIFAQMVDDPSANPDLFPTERAQEKERQRLFRIIEELVQWESSSNEVVLQKARDEIWQSWRRACAENADHARASELFDRTILPAFHDPFAGGGALPLEALRLGLVSYASDLNPVAVLINKAMIEIPPRFRGQPPVNPKARADNASGSSWKGASGLAEDVRHYGQWIRSEAEKRIGQLYPQVEVTAAMAKERPDLLAYVGKKLTVIAWLWARTVKSPNPAFSEVHVPLAASFLLGTKPGKEAQIEPKIEGSNNYRLTVTVGPSKDPERAKRGTKAGSSGSSFLCLMSGTPMPFEYLRQEAKAGRMRTRLMAIATEGTRERVYLPPTPEAEAIALGAAPTDVPDTDLPAKALGFRVQEYGTTKWRDLFSPRQLVALTTLCELVQEVHKRVRDDAVALLPDDGMSLDEGGAGATAYADAVSTYLAFGIDRVANYSSMACTWHSGTKYETVTSTFGRQTLPMTWDFAEANPLSEASGSWDGGVRWIANTLENLPTVTAGFAWQADAATQTISASKVVSTDPPYYDNIGYADLSDFFYFWLRRSLKPALPKLFSTVAVPKFEELVATPFRHGSRDKAEAFFLDGMTRAMRQLAMQAHPAFPVTIYYAFKQSESDSADGTASTGWETFIDAVIRAGFAITGTWPVRTEYTGNLKKNVGALASSIVLVCHPHPANSASITRRDFAAALRNELPKALAHLQRGNIAPVDLAQAAIGPGMAVFTRYSSVLDASGASMTVREALALINQVLDEALAKQEGDFDSDSRWALAWFDQHGFAEGEYGVAETLSKAKNTSVRGLEEAGILKQGRGRVRLFKPEELPEDWDPTDDARLTTWECVHHLIRALNSGEKAAADLVLKLGSRAEVARELAYRLYMLCERKKRPADAFAYNGLVQSWPEIVRLAKEGKSSNKNAPQTELFEQE